MLNVQFDLRVVKHTIMLRFERRVAGGNPAVESMNVQTLFSVYGLRFTVEIPMVRDGRRTVNRKLKTVNLSFRLRVAEQPGGALLRRNMRVQVPPRRPLQHRTFNFEH